MNLKCPALSVWYLAGTQTKAVPSLMLICINIVPKTCIELDCFVLKVLLHYLLLF